MDVLHSFMNNKKLKSKIHSKTSFSHMYKTSDKVGGTIHSKLPKMTMPKMVMPKISYNVPKYSSPKKNSFSAQNFNFSSLIRRDTHSRNETSSAPAPAHVTGNIGNAPSLNSLNNTFSNVISSAHGPADSRISQGPVRESKGTYGERYRDLKVEALTDSQAKALLPGAGATLSAGMSLDMTTMKQLEPYMKVGAVQLKPTDITASGISSSRISRGTGFTGPGDPTYYAGPIHDTGISSGSSGFSGSGNRMSGQQAALVNQFAKAMGQSGYTGQEAAAIYGSYSSGKSDTLIPEQLSAKDKAWITKYINEGPGKMTKEELAYQDTYLAHAEALKTNFGVGNVQSRGTPGIFDMQVSSINAGGGVTIPSTQATMDSANRQLATDRANAKKSGGGGGNVTANKPTSNNINTIIKSETPKQSTVGKILNPTPAVAQQRRDAVVSTYQSGAADKKTAVGKVIGGTVAVAKSGLSAIGKALGIGKKK